MSVEKKTDTKIEKPAPTATVAKRDGRTEEFMPEKIVVSVVKVGVPADVARKIARDIQGKVKGKISTAEIRKIVLENLRKGKLQWEQDWLIYERAVKKRTM
jgi:transcriptional repressor NrdR